MAPGPKEKKIPMARKKSERTRNHLSNDSLLWAINILTKILNSGSDILKK
jgi:hypothetical protein